MYRLHEIDFTSPRHYRRVSWPCLLHAASVLHVVSLAAIELVTHTHTHITQPPPLPNVAIY